MGINSANCCEKDEVLEQINHEREQIFSYSPEDDKIPNDASFVNNQGGEYPIETEEPADFKYEAKHPELVDGEKIVIQNLGPDKIYENDEDEIDHAADNQFLEELNMYELNNVKKGELMQIKNLIDLCNRNGKPRPCDDFDPKGYKMFYPEDDPYFASEADVIHNQLRIYNKEDKNNLQIYQGDLNSKGQRHGQGKCTTPYYVLIGQWKNDQFSGWGRESRCNGDVFEGRYENGVINGKGIFLNEKNSKYVGDFKNTRRWGKGDLTTDKIHYEGDFVNNEMSGKGRIRFLRDGVDYQGTFKNDQIDGYGVFLWRNGDRYEGQVKFGKMHGMGKYTFKNGKVYTGMFNMGKKMNERISMFQDWKKNGYKLSDEMADINGTNNVKNNLAESAGQINTVSDFRNKGFGFDTSQE